MNKIIAFILCWILFAPMWVMTSAAEQPCDCEALRAAVNQA